MLPLSDDFALAVKNSCVICVVMLQMYIVFTSKRIYSLRMWITPFGAWRTVE